MKHQQIEAALAKIVAEEYELRLRIRPFLSVPGSEGVHAQINKIVAMAKQALELALETVREEEIGDTKPAPPAAVPLSDDAPASVRALARRPAGRAS